MITISPYCLQKAGAPRLQLLGRCWGKAGAWSPVITPLPSAHSYNLSCELEPPSESASNTLRTKKNTAIVKRWSE